MAPVRLDYAVVNRAQGADLEQICGRMQALSAELKTRVERVGEELRVAGMA
jgi:hypothetical protein